MERYLVDFDGVIINSQEKFESHMGDNTNFDDWNRYLNSIDFRKFYRECEEIDDAFESLRRLQELRKLKAIVSTFHSFHEGEEKTLIIRENGIKVPVVLVLPNMQKSVIYPPQSKEDILIDDKLYNCEPWDKAGGDSILFRPKQKVYTRRSINSLKELL